MTRLWLGQMGTWQAEDSKGHEGCKGRCLEEEALQMVPFWSWADQGPRRVPALEGGSVMESSAPAAPRSRSASDWARRLRARLQGAEETGVVLGQALNPTMCLGC